MKKCANHSSLLCDYRARFPLLALQLVIIWLAVGLVKPHVAHAQSDTFSAYLQEGSCGESDPGLATPAATASPFAGGQDKPTQVFLTFDLDSGLTDLLATPRSILIDVDTTGVSTTVACGDITGVDVDGGVVVVMLSVETGGLVGVGVFRSEADEASRTSVEVHLVFSVDGAPIVGDHTPGTDEGNDAVDDDDAAGEPEDEPEGGV